MNKAKQTLLNLFLGVITCLLVVGVSTPSLSTITSNLSNSSIQNGDAKTFSASQSAQPALVQNPINQYLMSDLQEAESVLMAQSMPTRNLQRYAVILTKNNVVPAAPSTSATGVVGAVLVGERLVVRGDFGGLSSALRDYTTDPVNPPNPKITSAVHIHQGEPNQNGPFQYALTVTPNEAGMGGRLAGEYTLTSEQLQALADGKLYVDLHSQRNRAGELRGTFRPV
ncbi:CHRD domain-containing protein [Leptolyngbya sp. FACHB-261]|uniref:CHRD domain-containing protein n=1 Tax=Leptolyngbya sp. FACHB-261 TaxID=2692806 RepID=UPI0016855768|nr:CHRD domain-containing protein [Leptolyngbya sp. FACHB-261]MBD2102681.1 CHRD domain-containing protein [Leptolyngbya sp. FACHB-261]